MLLILPIAGLGLFLWLPLREALPVYVAVARTVRFPPRTGIESMVGREGIAATALRPAGYIRYQGELWRAAADSPVDPGTRVRIVCVERRPEGLTVLVEPPAPPPRGSSRAGESTEREIVKTGGWRHAGLERTTVLAASVPPPWVRDLSPPRRPSNIMEALSSGQGGLLSSDVRLRPGDRGGGGWLARISA